MSTKVDPWVRIGILVVGIAVAGALSMHFTGSIFPGDPRQALLFQNALLLIVLGSAILEHHYTKPADSVVNSLMGFITLLSVYGHAPLWPWSVVSGYCAFVFIISTTCVAVSAGKEVTGWRARLAQFTYRPSVVLGKSRLLFTVVFLSGLWFFHSVQDPITLALVLFWGLFLAIWPLKIPELLTSWGHHRHVQAAAVGELVRVDSPNILRVTLDGASTWSQDRPWICVLPDNQSRWVQPLYSQFKDGQLFATGLLTDLAGPELPGHINHIVAPRDGDDALSRSEIDAALGGDARSRLVGFVVEESEIGAIKVEALDPHAFQEGMLIWSRVGARRVYYQVVAGTTREESFAADKRGYQVATATQLGTLIQKAGFLKYEWLPAMNTPVYSSRPGQNIAEAALADDDFVLGTIPRSEIQVGGDFVANYDYHTALLGITGSGKTELAFDMIRHSVNRGVKVVCIDLTAQYRGRLSDLNPVDLSVPEKTADDLSQKLVDVETGIYGAAQEKKALGEFADTLRQEIENSVTSFFEEGNDSSLGLIGLQEISNTKATLWITELYMTCLLKHARDNRGTLPKILIVVEEAHTVMPEPNTMGLGDFESRGLVGKIAQIALQGRKYGVGLLVLAQRTATVSKTVLTQCNTIISFTCYDDTSLGFLRNIFGPEHVALIPNLPRLYAIAFGNWIRSEQPIAFEVPFDKDKARGE